MIYTILFSVLDLQGFYATTGAGLFIGFLHGFILSFILVTSVAEHHPLAEFREAGVGVALSHFLGHIIYGTLVGCIIGAYGLSLI